MPKRNAFFVCRTMGYGAAVRVIAPVRLQLKAMRELYRFDQYRYKAAEMQVKDGWYFRPVQLLPHRRG